MPRRYFHAFVGNDQIFEFLSKWIAVIQTLSSNELKLEFYPRIRFLASCLTLEMFFFLLAIPPATVMKQLQLHPNVCLFWRTDKNHCSKKHAFLNSAIWSPKTQIFPCELKNGEAHK